ncbi:MAG: hypothetical protein ACYS1A_18165 [Planctomycetota bacterium]
MSEENKKVISANISTTTIKILGIPVYSIKTNIEVDEDALYQKMENRFNKKMTEAIKKAQGGS